MVRKLIAPTMGLALALIMTGCGGKVADTTDDNPVKADAGQVAVSTPVPAESYDFSVDSVSTDSDMRLFFPQGLIEIAPDAQSLLIDSVVVSARKLRLPSRCAIDFAINYVDGGLEALLTQTQNYDQPSGPQQANEIPNLRNFVSELTDGEARLGLTIESLNEIAPEIGVYFSPDLKTMTRVEDCAKDSSDYAGTFIFPSIRASGGELYVDQFAEVMLYSTAGGAVTALAGRVPGFQVDSNGGWTPGW